MFPLLYYGIFVVIFQSSSGDFLSPQTATFEQGKANWRRIPPPYRQYIDIPQYNVPSGSIFANVTSVTLFTKTFFDAVYTNDILREVFDTRQTTAKQYGDFLRDYATKVFFEVGIENADELGEFAARAIEPNFDVLTLPVLARAYCNTAVNFLFMNGYLGLHNAEDLALSYAQAIADSAKVTMNSFPASKFPALAKGFIDFFDSLGLWTKRNCSLFGYLIGIEWFVAAVNYRWL